MLLSPYLISRTLFCDPTFFRKLTASYGKTLYHKRLVLYNKIETSCQKMPVITGY